MNAASPDALDAERELALSYATRDRRERLAAVWRLDARMRRIFVAGREPMLAQIKLAWWEERLAALADGPAPAEPLLEALAGMATTTGVAGELADLAGAWRALREPPWSDAEVREHARLRGRGLAGSAARALGADASEAVMLAGEGCALVDLARSTPDASTLAAARARFASAERFTWPRALRPFGMVVELARGDAVRGRLSSPGSPRRVARMAWHGMTGR